MQSPTKSLLLLLLSLSLTTVNVSAYSSGAPNNKNVCSSLIPGHGSRQNALSPYKLICSENMEGRMVVNMVATSQVTFAGFIVQARDADDLEKVIDGEFARSEGTQVRSCFSGKSNTWTHASGQTKTQVSTVWTPPAHFNGSVVFKGTVVQVKQAFWDQITSDPVYFLNGFKVDRPTYMHNRQPIPSQDEGTGEQLSNTMFDYESCAKRVCIGLGDEKCLNSKSCQALLTARQEGNEIDFTIFAKPSGDYKNKYYSMAFSEDAKMGDDLVVDCYSDSTGKVKLGLSFNSNDKSNEVVNVPNLLQDAQGRYAEGVITCKWKIAARSLAVKGKEFDLTGKKYHMLFAHGAVDTDDGEKSYHDIKTQSPQPVDLASAGMLVAKDLTYLIRIHGSFMVISWLALVSVAIIFARYFKDAWPQKLMCDVKIWFAFHRALMVTSITLMIIAQICIFYYVGTYRMGLHQILGSIAFTFALIQPLGALFRPHPDAPNRWLFNWMHWLGGNLGHITAVSAILVASQLRLAALPSSFLYIVIAWIIFHVVGHFIFQFHTSCVNTSKTSDIALHEMRNGERIYVEKRAQSTGSAFKSFILLIYILIVLLLTILLVVQINAPGVIRDKVSFL